MDTYQYKVRDKGGKLVQGTLEAESTTLVVNKLRQMGYVPLAIEKRAAAGVNKELKLPFRKGGGGKVKIKDVSIFCRQFATMINSGLSLLRSLAILAEQTDSKPLAVVLHQIGQDVEAGASLSHAMAKHPKAFNRLFVAMVKAGEAGGVLDSVLMQLASTIEKQVELRRKIKSALTYPVAVLCLVLCIVTAMLVFVVPTFKNIYKQLGGTLPLPTRLLIDISTIAKTWFIPIILLEVAAVYALKRWIQTEKGRGFWDRLKLRLPILGKLVHKTAMARFSRTLASLLRAGVPILESLEITMDTCGNVVVADAIKDVQEAVKTGESMGHRLAQHSIFAPMLVQMVAVGEETGAVDTMLDKIADFYEQEIEAMVAALTSLLEPLLIVVLGGAVGSMVISLYMPMFNIIKLIK